MQKKLIIIALSILGLLIVFAGLEKFKVIDLIHVKPATTDQQGGPSEAERKAEAKFNADAKQELIEGMSNKTSSGSNTNYSTIELSAKKDSDTVVTVFTKLVNISSGTCNLVVTNGSNKDVQSGEVIYQPEFSSCAGFSIPISKLGTGTWNISLSVNSNGQIKSNHITFEVR